MQILLIRTQQMAYFVTLQLHHIIIVVSYLKHVLLIANARDIGS